MMSPAKEVLPDCATAQRAATEAERGTRHAGQRTEADGGVVSVERAGIHGECRARGQRAGHADFDVFVYVVPPEYSLPLLLSTSTPSPPLMSAPSEQ